jgi:hypothetical protein
MVVAVVEVHGVAAAEDCEEKGCKTENRVNSDASLNQIALPSLGENAMKGDSERGLEKDVGQSIKSELKDLILSRLSVQILDHHSSTNLQSQR